MAAIYYKGQKCSGVVNVENAQTVNGHTIESDVPANAVFTDTIYDDTEIKKSVESKLDKNGSANNLKHSQIDFYHFATSIEGVSRNDETRKGEVIETPATFDSIGRVQFLKEIEGKNYAGGEYGFGYFNDDMSTFTPIFVSTTNLSIVDIAIAKKDTSGNITQWAMASSQAFPYLYDVETDTLTQYTVETYSLGYTFFPTVIYTRERNSNGVDYYLFFIDVNMSRKIGFCMTGNNYISFNFDFSTLENSDLTDICIIKDEKYDICLIAHGDDILFNDKDTYENWESFNNGYLFNGTIWEGSVVKKIYYDKETQKIYFIVLNEAVLETYSIDMARLSELGAEHQISATTDLADISPQYEIFGYNGQYYILMMSQVLNFMSGTIYELGVFENITGTYPLPISFCSHWVYNQVQNAFYFCNGGSNGDVKLFKLPYDREEKSLNKTLNDLLGLINAYEERITLLEELAGA